MKKISLRELIGAFNASPATDDYWYEHGINDEETAHGIRAVLDKLGIKYENDVLFDCGQLTTQAELDRQEAYRKEHPIDPSVLDTLGKLTHDMVLQDYIVKTAFNTSDAFNLIRGKLNITESPNKDQFTDRDK